MNDREILSTSVIIRGRSGLCLQTHGYHKRTMREIFLQSERYCDRSKSPQIFKNGLYLDREVIFWKYYVVLGIISVSILSVSASCSNSVNLSVVSVDKKWVKYLKIFLKIWFASCSD